MIGIYMLVGFSKNSTQARNIWIIICSIIFYAFADLKFVLLFVCYALIHYVAGKYMLHMKKTKDFPAVIMLMAICGIDVLLFVLWRFFAEPPFGFAFLTLKGISYVNDIYRDEKEKSPKFTTALVYILFFPVFKAGPLIKYKDMEEQIEERKITRDKFLQGIRRFVIGLAHVIILATPLLQISDYAFTQSNMSRMYDAVPISLMIVSTFCLLFALYHYYVGYSDMVLGLGGMLGFELMENFKTPILSISVSDLWERCYISLKSWFEEYIYKPLEKKQDNNDKMVIFTLLMWLALGLWLGGNSSKILFGVWMFVFIIWEKVTEFDNPLRKKNKIIRFIYIIVVMFIGVIMLKANSSYELTMYLGNLFGLRDNGFFSELALLLLKENWLIILIAFLTMFPWAQIIEKKFGEGIRKVGYVLYPIAMLGIVAILLITITSGSYDFGQYINFQLWNG